MSKIMYFSCQSGISGDMTIGAFLVSGIAATDFKVVLTDHEAHHRNLRTIEGIIEKSRLSDGVKELSKKIFHCLAEAEAKVHNLPIEQIHFHEVGAVDSIVDIVGTVICISLLEVDEIVSSPLSLGRGFVRCAHGLLPVPAPATVEILKGVPVYSKGIEGELVTPTGAAIIRTLVEDYSDMPPMTLEKIGYGAGKKEFAIPNLLRVFLGQRNVSEEQREEPLISLETNIDDMNPEIYSYLIPLLMERGALDAHLTNIIMKKGRPAVMLSVLCQPENWYELEELIFAETTTLGVRRKTVQRRCLERKILTVETIFGPVRAKAVYQKGRLLRLIPEYEECRQIASEQDLSLQEVYDINKIWRDTPIKLSHRKIRLRNICGNTKG